jgi:hypothetical protein
LSFKIVVSENIYYSKGEENTVILNYENGMYYGLDEIGSEYWELIQEYGDFDFITEKMLAKYKDVPKENIQSDLNELVKQLRDKGLVKVYSEGVLK